MSLFGRSKNLVPSSSQPKFPSVQSTTSSIQQNKYAWSLGGVLSIVGVLMLLYTFYVSVPPGEFDVTDAAMSRLTHDNPSLQTAPQPESLVKGYRMASTLASLMEILLHKRGGYITNDIMPPNIFLDDIKNWEYGALVMIRDASAALRNNFARAQSQSQEDVDLALADPLFVFDNNSWQLPQTESEYEKGLVHLNNYARRLAAGEASFSARADNLRQYLEVVEKRLGGYSTRLTASTERRDLSVGGQSIINTTPWMEVDDVFWEARGATWALLHLMKAIALDFNNVVNVKNAQVTVNIIIFEFEESQTTTLSPMVLNGSGFGLFANYSLTMANYITRANAAMLDFRDLLVRG